ncbi:MAG TPA: hypothetical protein DHW82_03425 [Spirochaetia bacterium]|nr:MAG: hypothetical protein A2Y41_12865 [Spirochaetes bacterium GWB1_36_13]HCL56043.1 hypothetical protein [Spirochaetia bacterium]
MENLLKLKENFTKQGILMSFNGSFSHSIIEEIGSAIRKYLEAEQLERGVISDVFSVYIEQTQNIRNYFKKKETITGEYSKAIVTIAQKDGHYRISSGNTILKEDVASLSAHIDRLNSLDKTQLKALYKEQLRKPIDPDSNSAGLGLIDIARKAALKLEYQFQNQDDEFDFFNLFVTVKGV